MGEDFHKKNPVQIKSVKGKIKRAKQFCCFYPWGPSHSHLQCTRSFHSKTFFTVILHTILNIAKGMFARLYVNDNERRPVPIFGLQILLRIYLADYQILIIYCRLARSHEQCSAHLESAFLFRWSWRSHRKGWWGRKSPTQSAKSCQPWVKSNTIHQKPYQPHRHIRAVCLAEGRRAMILLHIYNPFRACTFKE